MATAKKPKTEETPGYCKTEDLANLFGLTGQWINQLTRDGVIKRRDTPAGKRYNVVESVRAYTQYLRDKAASRGEKGIPEDKELEKFEAEVRIKRAKAQIAELEAKEVQGIMHRSEDVAAMTEDLIYTIRGSLMALPGRLAVDVVSAQTAAEAADIIRTEVFKLMQELSQYRYDPQKYEECVRDRMKWETEREAEGDDE
ncbi:MAG: protoporphyrinogen oxidase [Oscillospiraceae bacterium]|nr:protoporphyrinogen oxidase [Oscillospiraceae bacterium]